MILDIHTHVPAEAQWGFFLRQCRDNGVVIAATSALGSWARYPDPRDVRRANAEAARFAVYAKGMIRWFAYLNPQNDNWHEELKKSLADGACGIKMWVSLKDPDTGALERVPPVLKAARTHDLPVLMHTYHRTDENLPGEITVADIAEFGREFPRVRFIAAHAGGNWRQCLGLLRECPNVSVDVCGGYPETGMVEALVSDLGADRVLYGSDALGRSFPSQIVKVTMAAISEEEKAAILWENSARLLGIGREESDRARRAANALPASPVRALPAWKEDHFCTCGQWAFRGSPCADPQALDGALGTHRIERAYVSDARAVYSLDVLAANRRFAAAAAGCRHMAPLATMVPYAPNWRVVFEEARDHFAGGIVHPYLHNLSLIDPCMRPFLEACSEAKFPLWINASTGDMRFRARGTVCRNVSVDELTAFLNAAPDNSYVFQGASLALIQAGLKICADAGRLRFEISRLTDNSTALTTVVDACGWDQLVLGSEFPFRDLRCVRRTAEVLCQAASDA